MCYAIIAVPQRMGRVAAEASRPSTIQRAMCLVCAQGGTVECSAGADVCQGQGLDFRCWFALLSPKVGCSDGMICLLMWCQRGLSRLLLSSRRACWPSGLALAFGAISVFKRSMRYAAVCFLVALIMYHMMLSTTQHLAGTVLDIWRPVPVEMAPAIAGQAVWLAIGCRGGAEGGHRVESAHAYSGRGHHCVGSVCAIANRSW
eukprot:XP_001695375.1 predicted protein [Chlamydomonas reinhardtii]